VATRHHIQRFLLLTTHSISVNIWKTIFLVISALHHQPLTGSPNRTVGAPKTLLPCLLSRNALQLRSFSKGPHFYLCKLDFCWYLTKGDCCAALCLRVTQLRCPLLSIESVCVQQEQFIRMCQMWILTVVPALWNINQNGHNNEGYKFEVKHWRNTKFGSVLYYGKEQPWHPDSLPSCSLLGIYTITLATRMNNASVCT
jgi:hypothetical protein